MDERVHSLLGIISQEILLYRSLTEHARKKASLCLKGKAEEFRKYREIEAGFNRRLRNLENELKYLTEDLGRAFGIPAEEFTLLKLADHLEQATAREIKHRIIIFINLIQQLKSITRRNVWLVKKSLTGLLPADCQAKVHN